MFKVLIADTLPKEIIKKYNQNPDLQIDDKAGISKEDLITAIPVYDGLVVRSRTKATADILEAGKNLKVIGRAGAGVDNIDSQSATSHGIIVMNTPGGNTIAAAEHSVAMMLSTIRNIPNANSDMKQEKWEKKKYTGNELYEKTIGIIGLGKIGREVAKRLSAFDTTLLVFDPILTTDMARQLGVKLVEDLAELLEKSDIITIHAPKMAETIDLINKDKLKRCKDGVIIINCARGGIVNEQDLLDALNSGKVAKAALDVFSSEPPSDYLLAKHPNVVATPHLGASTEEAQAKVADQILSQMEEYFTKNVARNAVNFPSVEPEMQKIITPYFHLAERLGSVFRGMKSGRLKEITMRFYGDILALPVEPIAAHLIVGALKGTETELVNPVNGFAICKDRGISIEMVKKDKLLTSHTNLISCDLKTDVGFYHFAGTVFAKDIFHLTECGEFSCDANLDGHMLFIENDDIPGVVGHLGIALASYKVNIGFLSLARLKEKNIALNIFTLDSPIGEGVVEDLKKVKGVKQVYIVDL
jgi:D-3-phosphoglycerate dehydrogenase